MEVFGLCAINTDYPNRTPLDRNGGIIKLSCRKVVLLVQPVSQAAMAAAAVFRICNSILEFKKKPNAA